MHTHEGPKERALRAGSPLQREPTAAMGSCACVEPRPRPSPTVVPSGSQMWPIPQPSCPLERSKASRGHSGFCNDRNDVSFVLGSFSRPPLRLRRQLDGACAALGSSLSLVLASR